MALLLGTSAALALAGVAAALGTQTQPAVPPRTIVAAGLLALAFGVRIPQRLAIRAYRATFGDGTAALPHAAQRPLYWLVLAVLSLACGVALALSAWMARWVGAARSALLDRFLWSALPLETLDVLTALAAVLVPLGLLGLALSCAHHLCCRRAEWDELGSTWALIGAGGGMFLTMSLSRLMPPSMLIVGAALPALLVALVSALLGSTDTHPSTQTPQDKPTAPAWSDRWPALLRMAIAVVAGSGAFACAVWSVADRTNLPLALLGLGAGLAIGHRTDIVRLPSIGGTGVATSLSGLAVAFGAWAMTPGGPGGHWFWITLGACAIGCAVSYGQQTLLARVGSRSATGAYELSAMLAASAFSAFIAAPLALRIFAPREALLLAALLLIGLGGTLAMIEQDAPHRRRSRLGIVFASLAIMLALCARPTSAVAPTASSHATTAR